MKQVFRQCKLVQEQEEVVELSPVPGMFLAAASGIRYHEVGE